MPAVPASANDKFQVVVQQSNGGQACFNVLHFLAATGIDDVELRLILALIECYQTHLAPGLSSMWTLDRVVWKQVSPILGPEHITIPAAPIEGGASGDAMTSFCAAVLSIRTAQGGKSRRGRMFLGGLPENATIGDQNVIATSSTTWDAVIAFAACLVTKFILGDPPAANSFQMEVYSRKLGGATFPYGVAGFTAVTSIVPNQVIGTMRSRKKGHGI